MVIPGEGKKVPLENCHAAINSVLIWEEGERGGELLTAGKEKGEGGGSFSTLKILSSAQKEKRFYFFQRKKEEDAS